MKILGYVRLTVVALVLICSCEWSSENGKDSNGGGSAPLDREKLFGCWQSINIHGSICGQICYDSSSNIYKLSTSHQFGDSSFHEALGKYEIKPPNEIVARIYTYDSYKLKYDSAETNEKTAVIDGRIYKINENGAIENPSYFLSNDTACGRRWRYFVKPNSWALPKQLERKSN